MFGFYYSPEFISLHFCFGSRFLIFIFQFKEYTSGSVGWWREGKWKIICCDSSPAVNMLHSTDWVKTPFVWSVWTPFSEKNNFAMAHHKVKETQESSLCSWRRRAWKRWWCCCRTYSQGWIKWQEREEKSGKMGQGTRSYTNRKLKHSQLSSPTSLYIFPSFCEFYSSSNSDIYFSSLSPPCVGEIFSFLNYPSQRCCVLVRYQSRSVYKRFFYDESAVRRGWYLISSSAHNNTSKVIVCTIS